MKIVSWNVNGLAAYKRKGFLRVLARSGADIFCCQEIKTRCPLSTPGYLQFWNPAKRPGYSGTLILTRKEPISVRRGMGIGCLDEEGRLILLEYESFYEEPYWDLREFFRLCRQPSVALTFSEIEQIIGFELDWEARYFQAFWFDEAPAYVGGRWEKEFPFHAVEPSRQASEYVTSDACRSQGCRIQRLDLAHGKVVFHREVYGTVGLAVPPALLRGRIPENAAHEATAFFAYLIKKYGL